MPNASTNTVPMCADPEKTIYRDCIGCWDLHITHFEGKTWQEKLNACNECMCCDQHQDNRPSKFEPYYNDDEPYDETWTKNNCTCRCEDSAKQLCYYGNYHLMTSAPDANDLPMPPLKWRYQHDNDININDDIDDDIDNDLSMLDEATDEALDHYWKGRVKACQYAIFHIC